MSMKYRDIHSSNNLTSSSEYQERVRLGAKGINRLNELIDWGYFRKELESILGYDSRDDSKGGRPPFDPVFMLKVLVLQQFYNLSDAATEEQIEDRFSFMKFLDLRVGDSIPDQNTIWDFRESLEAEGRDGTRKLFDLLQKLLKSKGIMAMEGSIVDASFVEVPRQRNSREENKAIKSGERPKSFEKNPSKNRQKDCDARWVKKNGQNYYGYKNHTKVDAKSKLVIAYTTTSASVHDSQVFEDLVDSQDNAIFADSAYCSERTEAYILEHCDAQEFVVFKAQKGKPLTKQEKISNKLRRRIRVRVEHVYARMQQLGMDWFRRIGIIRANQHNGICNLVYNLDRYAFLCTLP